MTEIQFHHEAPDKLLAACQLIDAAWRQGRRILVYAPQTGVAAQIDKLLWTQSALSFIPHCRNESPLAAETPVVIGASLDDASHHDVLLNLDGELPSGFSRFEQLIEIVGRDEEDKQAARVRYKFYKERGYPLSAKPFSA